MGRWAPSHWGGGEWGGVQSASCGQEKHTSPECGLVAVLAARSPPVLSPAGKEQTGERRKEGRAPASLEQGPFPFQPSLSARGRSGCSLSDGVRSSFQTLRPLWSHGHPFRGGPEVTDSGSTCFLPLLSPPWQCSWVLLTEWPFQVWPLPPPALCPTAGFKGGPSREQTGLSCPCPCTVMNLGGNSTKMQAALIPVLRATQSSRL